MKDASKEIMRFWKTQWEAYMKSMMAMQEQGETMLEMIQKSGVLQEGSLNMIRDWAKKYKSIQKSYLDAVEEHFEKLDDIIGVRPEWERMCWRDRTKAELGSAFFIFSYYRLYFFVFSPSQISTLSGREDSK